MNKTVTQNYQKRSRLLRVVGRKRQAAVVAVNARRAPAPLCTAEMPHHHLAARWKRVGPPALADTTASRGRRSSCYPLRAAAPACRPPLWAWLLLLLPSARAGAVLKETGRACSGPDGATAAYQAKHMGNYTTPDACADAAAEDPDCTGWVIAYPPNYGSNPSWGCRCCKGDGSGGPLNAKWNLYAISAKTPPPPSASPSPPPTQALLDCFASRSFPDGTLQKSGEPPRDPTSTRGHPRSRPPLTTRRQCRFSAPRVGLRLRGRQRLQHAQRMRRRSHRLLWSCDGLP